LWSCDEYIDREFGVTSAMAPTPPPGEGARPFLRLPWMCWGRLMAGGNLVRAHGMPIQVDGGVASREEIHTSHASAADEAVDHAPAVDPVVLTACMATISGALIGFTLAAVSDTIFVLLPTALLAGYAGWCLRSLS